MKPWRSRTLLTCALAAAGAQDGRCARPAAPTAPPADRTAPAEHARERQQGHAAAPGRGPADSSASRASPEHIGHGTASERRACASGGAVHVLPRKAPRHDYSPAVDPARPRLERDPGASASDTERGDEARRQAPGAARMARHPAKGRGVPCADELMSGRTGRGSVLPKKRPGMRSGKGREEERMRTASAKRHATTRAHADDEAKGCSRCAARCPSGPRNPSAARVSQSGAAR